MEVKRKKKTIITAVIVATIILILSGVAYVIFGSKFYIESFNDTVELEVYNEYKKPKLKACYGNAFYCNKVKYELISNEPDNEVLNTYKVKYKLQYHSKEQEIIQTVKVVDKKEPILEIEEKEVELCPGKETLDISKKAYDNYDGDLSESIKETRLDNYFLYEVSDSSGNKTEAKVSYKYVDNEKPKITLKGKKTITVYLNNTFTEPGYTASDNCDGDITKNVTVEGNVDTATLGIYTIKYSVKDAQGNADSIERKISVINKPEPVVQNPTTEEGGKTIYLTFDDGPSSYTNKLLDILNQYNVKVTFFVTGTGINKGYGAAVKRAYEEGHTIALHTYSHDYKTVYTSEEAYFDDLNKVKEMVKELTGHEATLIRFPGGSSNTVSRFNPGIMSRLTQAVADAGYHYFDWNISSGDAGETKTTAGVVKNVTKAIKGGNSYVVLQHDVKGYSVNAVAEIIEYGISKGYTFKALTENSPTYHHPINN